MSRSIDIVIRSYYRDWQWLILALRSIDLFVTGHRRVVVVLPRASLSRVDLRMIRAGSDVLVRSCRDYRDDYLGQQITKLHADRHTDADLIVHLDSDQVFVAPCDLRERLLDGDRPQVSYDSSGRRPATDEWRRCPEVFLSRPLRWDLTTPPPLLLPRQVHADVRAYCRSRHGIQIAEYARAASAARFCELAILRGFALVSDPDGYAWVDVCSGDPVPECRTFWSRAESPGLVAHRLPEPLVALATRTVR